MAGKIVFETIDPATLGAEARVELCRKLYLSHCQIFDGVEVARFERKVINAKAQWNKIRIYKNQDGAIVGYCALHAFEKTIDAQGLIVVTIETGLMRGYRRQGNVLSFLLLEALRFKLAHPLKKTYVFCTLVHPSSYLLMVKGFPHAYPNPRSSTPADMFRMMEKIADAFDEKRAADGDPALREVGWITRQSEEEKAALAQSGDADMRFFLEKNPGYPQGRGLMTLVPLTLANVLLAALKFVAFLTARRLRNLSRKSPTA